MKRKSSEQEEAGFVAKLQKTAATTLPLQNWLELVRFDNEAPVSSVTDQEVKNIPAAFDPLQWRTVIINADDCVFFKDTNPQDLRVRLRKLAPLLENVRELTITDCTPALMRLISIRVVCPSLEKLVIRFTPSTIVDWSSMKDRNVFAPTYSGAWNLHPDFYLLTELHINVHFKNDDDYFIVLADLNMAASDEYAGFGYPGTASVWIPTRLRDRVQKYLQGDPSTEGFTGMEHLEIKTTEYKLVETVHDRDRWFSNLHDGANLVPSSLPIQYMDGKNESYSDQVLEDSWGQSEFEFKQTAFKRVNLQNTRLFELRTRADVSLWKEDGLFIEKPTLMCMQVQPLIDKMAATIEDPKKVDPLAILVHEIKDVSVTGALLDDLVDNKDVRYGKGFLIVSPAFQVHIQHTVDQYGRKREEYQKLTCTFTDMFSNRFKMRRNLPVYFSTKWTPIDLRAVKPWPGDFIPLPPRKNPANTSPGSVDRSLSGWFTRSMQLFLLQLGAGPHTPFAQWLLDVNTEENLKHWRSMGQWTHPTLDQPDRPLSPLHMLMNYATHWYNAVYYFLNQPIKFYLKQSDKDALRFAQLFYNADQRDRPLPLGTVLFEGQGKNEFDLRYHSKRVGDVLIRRRCSSTSWHPRVPLDFVADADFRQDHYGRGVIVIHKIDSKQVTGISMQMAHRAMDYGAFAHYWECEIIVQPFVQMTITKIQELSDTEAERTKWGVGLYNKGFPFEIVYVDVQPVDLEKWSPNKNKFCQLVDKILPPALPGQWRFVNGWTDGKDLMILEKPLPELPFGDNWIHIQPVRPFETRSDAKQTSETETVFLTGLVPASIIARTLWRPVNQKANKYQTRTEGATHLYQVIRKGQDLTEKWWIDIYDAFAKAVEYGPLELDEYVLHEGACPSWAELTRDQDWTFASVWSDPFVRNPTDHQDAHCGICVTVPLQNLPENLRFIHVRKTTVRLSHV